MKMFTYKAKNISGEIVKGEMYCEDYHDFLVKIYDRGLYCIHHSEVDENKGKKAKKISTKNLAFCCRQLSAMLSAGVTLVKALGILYNEQPNGKLKQIWLDIYEHVQKGRAFSDAIKIQSDVFPLYFISMVSAGESSGSLDTIMERLSEHYLKESKMDNKIKGALMYPIILSVLSILIVTGLFIFILPKFMLLFEQSTLPPLTKVMMGIVNCIKNKWYIFILGIISIILIIIYSLKIEKTRIKIDRHLIKMNLIGKLVIKIYENRFARTLSSLYSSGIPMVECIEHSVAVLGNRYISSRFKEVIDNVKQGEALSEAILKIDVFDSMFCSIIYVGEESGSLDEILLKMSDYYEDEAESSIQRLISMLEPVLIIILGVFVGLIVASILPALYSSLGSIQ